MRNYAGDAASYPTNTQLPNDGDDANAATFDAALKPLADRTAYLKAFKDSVESAGVTRVRTVATFTELATLTGMAEGDIVLLPAYGLYRYEPTVAPAAVPYGLPWVITPAAGTAGVWMNVSTMLTDIAGGTSAKRVATLDSAGKVPKARTYRPAYEIVGVYDVETTANETVNAADFYSATSALVTDPLQAGDLLEAQWTGRAGSPSSVGPWTVGIMATHGSTLVGEGWRTHGAAAQNVTAFLPRVAVSPAGAMEVFLRFIGSADDPNVIWGGSRLSVTVLRAN